MTILTVIVGAGGTGSYVINNLLNLYRVRTKERHRVMLIDGDVVEEKNLLRQGFLRKDLNKGKSEALINRFRGMVGHKVLLAAHTGYVQSLQDIDRSLEVLMDLGEKVDPDDISEVILVSCVDNNLARLRLTMAQFKVYQDFNCRVSFVDSGNEEWYGQVLVSVLDPEYPNPVTFNENRVKFDEGKIKGHWLNNIFVLMDDWKNKLTRGDHEISCDVITESSPQNIATNMTAASGVLLVVKNILDREPVPKNVFFNTKQGVNQIKDNLVNQEQYSKRLNELVEYVNGEGKVFIFSVGEDYMDEDLVDEEDYEDDLDSLDGMSWDDLEEDEDDLPVVGYIEDDLEDWLDFEDDEASVSEVPKGRNNRSLFNEARDW
ncbi:ThiF family adenylyltransferase [Bacillus subtilis]|uniref:ThiF family adenylyltransferase n=1 Tax=Bacillus subtilis TaxID=1423 RepID=UPI003F83154C